VLEARHVVVGEPGEDHVSPRPLVGPQVKHVVQRRKRDRVSATRGLVRIDRPVPAPTGVMRPACKAPEEGTTPRPTSCSPYRRTSGTYSFGLTVPSKARNWPSRRCHRHRPQPIPPGIDVVWLVGPTGAPGGVQIWRLQPRLPGSSWN
jgi:hypothetical protein